MARIQDMVVSLVWTGNGLVVSTGRCESRSSAAALAFINRQRARMAQRPLDPERPAYGGPPLTDAEVESLARELGWKGDA